MLVKSVVLGFPAIERQLAKRTTDKVVAVGGWRIVPAGFHHLLDLAGPAAFRFVRPSNRKCSSSGSGKVFAGGILQGVGISIAILSSIHQNGPATVTRMFQMFLHRVVVWLPAIEGSFAEVADGVIIARAGGLVVEAGSGQFFGGGRFVRPS